MKKIKLKRNESMLTASGRIDFKFNQVAEVEDWIAASLVGRGYADYLEAGSPEKVEVKSKAKPPKEPFKKLVNDVSKAPVAKQDKKADE